MKQALIRYSQHFTLCILILQNLNAQSLDSSIMNEEIEKNANPYMIDYPNLDSKYYPYIRAQNKYYDSDIKRIIYNVDSAERKNAFFVGILYGVNINFAVPVFSNMNLVSSNNVNESKETNANFSLFGLRAGYQKYTGSVLPINTFGYQIYIDFCVSSGKGGLFFTGINTDMLWDFMEEKSWIVGLNVGLGIGAAKITGLAISPYGDKYEPAYRLNFGLSIRYPSYHQKVGLYLGIIQGVERGYLGLTPTIGYDYVF